MFLERIRDEEELAPGVSSVFYIPLECTLACHCFSHKNHEIEALHRSVEEDLPFFPFIYDLEEKEDKLYVLTDPVPTLSLADYVTELSSVKTRYYFSKIIYGLLEWLNYLDTSACGLQKPELKSFRVTTDGEIIYPSAWKLWREKPSVEVQTSEYLGLLNEMKAVFEPIEEVHLPACSEISSWAELVDYVKNIGEALMYRAPDAEGAERTIALDRHECKNHPDKKGEYRCRICQSFFCQECVLMIHDHAVCSSCLENSPQAVSEFMDRISPESRQTFYGMLDRKFFGNFFSMLFFNYEAMSSLFQNISLKEAGIFILFYLAAVFFGFGQMNYTRSSLILAWQFSGIGLFFVIALLWFNYDNPLQILFVLVFPVLATGVMLCLPGYFWPVPVLYFGFIWSSLLTINFLIYSLKIEIHQVFITWIMVVFILFTFMSGLLS